MSLTLTLIQSNLTWENKDSNLQMFSEKIDGIKEKTEVVILPEMFSTGFSMNTAALAEKMDGKTIHWMKQIASSKKIILTGSLIIEEGGNYFYRLVWMLPNGQYGYYDKRHLFAFAGEEQHYTRGNKRLIASVKGWKINLLICYDLRFPVWSRQKPLVNSGLPEEAQEEEPGNMQKSTSDERRFEYDVLVYVANWPEKRSTAWKTLLRARAIENQSFVIGVNRVGEDANKINYSGDSMIIDPLGEVISMKTNQEDVFTVTLQKENLEDVRGKFPFWKDADDFNL